MSLLRLALVVALGALATNAFTLEELRTLLEGLCACPAWAWSSTEVGNTIGLLAFIDNRISCRCIAKESAASTAN